MRLHGLFSLLAVTLVVAGEAPLPGPAIEGRLADGAVLIEHWNKSVYGRLWLDPVCDPLRDQLAKAQTAAGWTVKPQDACATMTAAMFRLDGFSVDAEGNPLPKICAQLDLGGFTPAILASLRDTLALTDAIAVPNATESYQAGPSTLVARFDSLLMSSLGHEPVTLKPAQAPEILADLRVIADLPRLLAQLKIAAPDLDIEQDPDFAALVEVRDARLELRAEIVPEGLHETLTLSTLQPGSRVLDQTALARLPANTLMTLGYGFSGKDWWPHNREMLLLQLGTMSGQATPADSELWLDQQLTDFGLKVSFGELIGSLDGTFILAVTQGMPFPGATCIIPRSGPLDQAVKLLLALVQVEVPGEGAVVPVPIPELPIPIQIACDKNYWLLTSDPVFAAAWPAGDPGGWAEGKAGKAALAKAGDQALMVGSSDTPNVLRTIVPWIQMVMPVVGDGFEQQQMQAATLALNKLAGMASTGWVVARREGSGVVIEDQGLVGMSSLLALGAVARWYADENGVHLDGTTKLADESEVAAILKSTLFPAEIQFQSGCYVDQDGDGIGEFGLLDELAGLRPTGKAPTGSIKLVPAELVNGQDGYQFTVYLPAAQDGCIDEPDEQNEARPADAAAAKAQARRFVAYAWPEADNSGGRIFAITQEGTVYVADHDHGIPAWDALFGQKDWAAKPVWKRWKAGDRTKRTTPQNSGEIP